MVSYMCVPIFSPLPSHSQKFLGMEYRKVAIRKFLKCIGSFTYRNPAPRGRMDLKLESFATGAQGYNILKFESIPPKGKKNRKCIRYHYILDSYGERVLRGLRGGRARH